MLRADNTEIEEPKVKTGLINRIRRLHRNYRILRRSRNVSLKEKDRSHKRLEFYSQFVREGDLCFDVGANIGNRVQVLGQIGARIVAIEPQGACVRVLNEKFGTDPRVHIVNKALDKSSGKKAMFIDRSHTLSSMSKEWIHAVKKSGRFSTHEWDDKVEVATTTLDLLIEQYGRPDFCKIDVEGFEFEVLQGLSQPIGIISFEFTSEYPEPSTNCIRYLSDLGMTEFNYDLGESMRFALSSWLDTRGILDTLQVLGKEPKSQGDIYARMAVAQVQ